MNNPHQLISNPGDFGRNKIKSGLSVFTFLFLFTAFSGCSQSNSATHSDGLKENSGPDGSIGAMAADSNWTTRVEKTNEEWKKILSPEIYYITREQGTEKPFSSPLYENHEKGLFICICCNNPLFSSDTKFESGTGWPSYFAPYSTKSVKVADDNSHGMARDEVACARCDAHLGHVFDDGPKPTGLRYCMDGLALQFIKYVPPGKMATATFAAGCFWCEENIFENVIGVKDVISGYAGGKEKKPTYESVGSGRTGHAEAFEFAYDSSVISYPQLLKVYFASQDPTQVNGQGPDHGTQYRSVVFYRNEAEKKMVEDYILALNNSGKYSSPIATEVLPFTQFWIAEEYHQDYIKHHPENPYVQHESIPRFNRTKERVPEFFNK
jgi:peptide methionine sulfoxide reductase msrA/msrB